MKKGLHNYQGMFKPIWLAVSIVVLVAVVFAGVYAWRALRPDDGGIPEPAYWPTTGWESSPPEAQGIDSAKLAEGLAVIPQNNVGIHSLHIVRGGYLIVDAYFYPYDGSIYHDFASVTKSVTTTLIGIAADQGKLDLDKPVLSFFPNRTIANRDEQKERITVRHLLTMSSGLEWDPVDDEVFLRELRASNDWVQFALDLPVVSEPGTPLVYNSAGMHLLSAILTQTTGVTALEFAELNLFQPLGITEVHWTSDPQGYNRGWGDLSLFPKDAAKLGFLFLHQGEWEGRQLVSRDWVTNATSIQISSEGSSYEEYGYGWWVSPEEEELINFRAQGRNGQRITVFPSMDMVIVLTGYSDGIFEDIAPDLQAAIGNLDAPLSANAEGFAQLEKIIQQLKQPPEASPIPLPEITSHISGKTFVFESNPAQIESIRIDFDSPATATFYLKIEGESDTRIGEIGLDGTYGMSQGGIPWIARGSWIDAQTLVVEYNQGPGLEITTLRTRFEDDRILLEISGLNLEGKLD